MLNLKNKRFKNFTQAVRMRYKHIVALVLVFIMATAAVFANFAGDGFIGRIQTNDDVADDNNFHVQDIAVEGSHYGDFVTTGFGGHGHSFKEDVYYYVTIARGQSIESVLPMAPELKGISFVHWSLMPNGAPFYLSQLLYRDTTFYAIWSEVDLHTYDVHNDDYMPEAPHYLYEEDEHNEVPGYSYDMHDYGYSNEEQDVYSTGYEYEIRLGYDFAYEQHSDYYDYGNVNECVFAFAYNGYSPDIMQAPAYLYSGHENNEGPDYGFAYSIYDEYCISHAYSYELGHVYDYDSGYDSSYYYDYDSIYSNNYDNAYDNGYDWYGYVYESGPSYLEDYTYENGHAEGDTIVITFRLNPDGRWLNDIGIFHHDGEVSIDVDARGNISVYPTIMHMVILDGDFIHVRLPMEIALGNVSVGIVNGSWTYNLRHEVEFIEQNMYDEDGEPMPNTERTYTVVTINHDILEHHAQFGEMVYLSEPITDGMGFMPFASNPPFSMVDLLFPFDNQSWLTAINTPFVENRVVVVPHNVNFPSVVHITGSRYVIITTQDVDLGGSTTNHTFSGTPAVITHTGTSGRHFTVGNGTTLHLSHIVLCGNVIIPSTSNARGGITVNSGGSLRMLSGSVIRNSMDWSSGGGVQAAGNAGIFAMYGNSLITGNNAGQGYGGGVSVTGARIFTMNDTSSIANNRSTRHGAGVALTASGATFNMLAGSITGNTANDTTVGWGDSGNGGGVALTANNTHFTMSGGSISGNSASGSNWGGANLTHGNGGGVWMAAGTLSSFTFNAGSIHNNHAHTFGGGIFTTEFMYTDPLPTGAYPQLDINAAAVFNNNTAGRGSFTPPSNALTATAIQTTQSSGGFSHPLNNLDINFISIAADWFRLNSAVQGTSATNIVIHPSGTIGITDGLVGSTYNLIISDPSDGGNVITTIALQGGTTPHNINISRPVTIQAANGADIILRMPTPGATNTPSIAPWLSSQTTLSRHFVVLANGNLTLNGIGSGTLTLDGNANLLTQARGGILIGGIGADVTLESGAFVTNNRAANGGGVQLSQVNTHLTMSGGVISHNFATTSGGGVHLVAVATSLLTFNSGSITNNHAAAYGGGVFAGMFTYEAPLPVGNHFPQMVVNAVAVFNGNTAGNGGFDPPINAVTNTQIQSTAQVSGGFSHPLNNLDINFVFGDWMRLSNMVATPPFNGNTHITIHPTGSSVTPGMSGDGFTYNFIITDPGDGSTINTMPIAGAPAADPRRINVLRNVTIQATSGADIVFDMIAPANVGRHFMVGAGGNLTLLGLGTGTLTLNGNANSLTGNRGGIIVNGAGAAVTLGSGAVVTNNRAVNGGGVQLSLNNTHLNINGGIVSHNFATTSGGGVHLAAGAASLLTFNSGSIINNHAATDGGGIFTSTFTYIAPLPAGNHFPQLVVNAVAVFNGNTAGNGSFIPPANAAVNTQIQSTAQVSGGFNHPLNNLDINFVFGDWIRLNNMVEIAPFVGNTHITIHPTGSSVIPGMSADGFTYNFVILDPGDGSTINTMAIAGAPAADPHRINVLRNVTIQAAADADIVFDMIATAPANIGRHFLVGTNGHLTLRGLGTGTLTLNGNANSLAGLRGGVNVNAGTGALTLDNGGVITNGRATSGGAVLLNVGGVGTHFTMTGGTISNNIANTSGGGIALTANDVRFNMSGGSIYSNVADGIAVDNGGGGIHIAAGAQSHFTFNGGIIHHNHAALDGGGIFTASAVYGSPLPAGMHYTQLTVGALANFNNNTAGRGSAIPPANATAATAIAITNQVSGGFLHPLNNYDINFISGDWQRLNNLVGNALAPNPARIIIHPAGTGGVTPGLSGTDYNFIISPGYGSIITTSPILVAPAADLHRINVLRTVSIVAAPGTSIILDMSATTPLNIGRHFTVGWNSHLTLGAPGIMGTLTLNGNADTLNGNRGGVNVIDGTGSLTMAVGGIIYNNRAASGGGVQLNSGGANPQLVIAGGSINNNIATANGGGVAQAANNTHVVMNSGTISGNVAAGNGGGVFLSAGVNSRFHFNGGAIQNNTAGFGGGIFASEFTYEDPLPSLPVGNFHYPQLTVALAAIFNNNNATAGGFTPPVGVLAYTNITNAAQRSGGFAHPINNLDINFLSTSADWFRLNAAVQNPEIDTIVIHPHFNVSGVIENTIGPVFNMVITNNANPFAVVTLALGGGTTHTINVTRDVIIQSAGNHNIVLDMSLPGTPGRHFNVSTNGILTLGSQGTGILALDGNRQFIAGARGGMDASSNAIINLQSGAVIRNNSFSLGGGITIGGTAVVNMYDGSYITENISSTGNAGGGGVGTHHWDHNATLNMFGGTISYNTAEWGGGIWAMSGRINIYDGYIINNNAGMIGVGAPNAGALDGTIGNPHGAGGGIRVCCRGVVVMHGGTIGGNTARYGGGVLLSHGTAVDDPIPSSFIMYGGNIINNTASLAYINPDNQHPGWVHNEDGGGMFIMSSGLFEMRDDPTGTRTINISGNTAGQHGGGVFWQVGRWDTEYRLTQPVNMYDNHAEQDGGAIFLSFRTLDMKGNWSIGQNSANRGGGVFLHGNNAPYTYDPVLGWLPHPLMGYGRLVMHDEGIRIHSNHSQTSGGGVYIFRDAIFEMEDGSIDNNESEVFGGGVYVFNPGTYFTSRFEARGGQITRNRAIYGGGVYLMFRAHMLADNVVFAGNEASRMGGAIFTELVDYGYWLSGMEVPHEILPEIPGHPLDPNEVFFAFTNLEITDTVRFGGYSHDGLTYFGPNDAMAAFPAPYNALDMTNIRWLNWDAVNPVDRYEHLSIHIHPFNNYDINYVRPVYFYKTDMEIYSYPSSINNLAGAVFALDIRTNYDPVAGTYDWVPYTTVAGVPVTAISEANGRVTLFVFTEGVFRLREVTPPPGLFVPPPGHWVFEMRVDEHFIDGVPGLPDLLMAMYNPPPQPCPLNTEFFFVLLDRETGTGVGDPLSQEARMRWHVGNAPPRVELYLHKAGEGIIGMSPSPTTVSQLNNMLRPGAVFALYRYLGTDTPADTLVPAPGWVRTYGLHTSTGSPADPIELIRLAFRADQDFSYYQLVELIPPASYMAPFGQWRVRMEYDLQVAQTATAMHVIPQGDSSTPQFVRLTGEDGFTFAVGNRRNPDLPLTGGLGARDIGLPMAVAGSAVVLLGVVALAYLVLTRELNGRTKQTMYKKRK